MAPTRTKKSASAETPLTDDYVLGAFLGKGAFGTVYAVDRIRGSGTTKWACKMAPEQKPGKGKKSVIDRLYFESIMYTQQLPHLCGTIIPALPAPKDRLKSYYHSLNGNHCLIMERMQCELFHAVPALLDSYRSQKEIPFGPLAVRLIDLVEAIHKTKNILLDVKPDNLMVDCNLALTKSFSVEALVHSIRLVDLGLLKSIAGTDGKHEVNLPSGQVQGTPLYASLHVHDLQTPSRRDDLYAMLLVLADLVLNIYGPLNQIVPPYGTGKSASYLPWSQETSDNAIGNVKTTQLTDRKSSFYESLPSPAMAKAFYTALEQTHQTNYARIPDYDAIRNLLANLRIPIPLATCVPVKKASKKRSAVASSTVDITSPVRRSTRRTTLPSSYVPPVTHDVAQQENDDVVMMVVDEENKKPAAKVQQNSLQLLVTGGPNNTLQERIVLDGMTSSVTIGSSSQKSSVVLAELSPSHVRLTLSKQNNAVFVEPMGKSVVQVNRMKVAASGMMAFVGQSISFGSYSIASVQPFVPGDDEIEPMDMDGAVNEDFYTRPSRVGKAKKAEEHAPPAKKKKKLSSFLLQVVSPASMKGTKYLLEQGTSLQFGWSVVSKHIIGPKERFAYLRGTDIAPRHATLSLVEQRGTLMVKVCNLEGTSTWVNNLPVPPWKEQMAFCNGTIRFGGVTLEIKKNE